MNNVACFVTSYLVNSVWEVAAIGGAGWVVSRLLKWFGPRVQHVIWVATLALSIAAPMVPLCRSLLGSLDSSSVVSDAASTVAVATPSFQRARSNSILLPPGVIQLLSLLYLTAVLYCAARLAWLLRDAIAVVRGGEPASLGPDREELWNRSKQAFSVQSARILVSQRICSPVAAGFSHPVLLVPDGFPKICTSQDFLTALAHECAHIKRRDFQKNLLYEMAALFVAYHPVIWAVKSQIAQTREMICDEMAAEKLVGTKAYVQSLLRLATMLPFTGGARASGGIGIFDSDILERRIMKMRMKKKHLTLSMKCGLMAAGTLLLCSVAVTSGAMTRVIEAQPSSTDSGTEPGGVAAKKVAHKDLSCTYYDNQNRGYNGTCGTKKGDKTNYYCFRNDDKSVVQLQTGCEVKLRK
jgi:beta-lactamase regulating signal transducer with metallopeptidase domain